jgi:hypothetical protein
VSPERAAGLGGRGAVEVALRGGKHLQIKVAGGASLYVDVLAAGATHVRLRPWGWKHPIDLEIAEVTSAVPAAGAATRSRVDAISVEQRALEATWPR